MQLTLTWLDWMNLCKLITTRSIRELLLLMVSKGRIIMISFMDQEKGMERKVVVVVA